MNSQHARIREKLINLAGSLYLFGKPRRSPDCQPSITVVNYHSISGVAFRKHLDYFRQHYRILHPDLFLNWLDDKTIIDEPSVVISFDDGYLSFYEEIYPILKATQVPVLMFIPTGFIGNSHYFWEDEVQVALEKTNVRSITLNGKKFHSHDRFYRTDFHENIRGHLRSLGVDVRNEAMKYIFARLGVAVTAEDMKDYQFLTWPQVVEMQRSGLVVFGSHTVHHPKLTLLSRADVLYELEESKQILQKHIGKSVLAFAFPYGDHQSFNEKVVAAVREAGYACAFTGIQGTIKDKRENRFNLKRIMLFDYQNEGAVALKLDVCSTDRRYARFTM